MRINWSVMLMTPLWWLLCHLQALELYSSKVHEPWLQQALVSCETFAGLNWMLERLRLWYSSAPAQYNHSHPHYVTLYIIDLFQFHVCCIRSCVTQFTHFMVLHLWCMCRCRLHAVSHKYTYAPPHCRTS